LLDACSFTKFTYGRFVSALALMVTGSVANTCAASGSLALWAEAADAGELRMVPSDTALLF